MRFAPSSLRHLFCAEIINLNAMAKPVLRLRQPLVFPVRWRTVAKVLSEYRTNENPFPKVDRVRPSHPTVANPRFGAVSGRITPSGWVEIVQFSQFLDDSWLWAERHRNRDARRRSLWGCCPGGLVQSDKRACGGARQGGRRVASGSAPFSSRCVRIFSMTSGSSMHIWTHPVCKTHVRSRQEKGCYHISGLLMRTYDRWP